MRIISALIIFGIWASGWQSASALEIHRVDWNGHTVLGLIGYIEAGDAEAVGYALSEIAPLPHGHAVVLLGSPGGSVEEAFKIADIFDAYEVHTVIPSGGMCASACGSILFISGHYRTIEHGGLLGQHTCSRGGIPDDDCNEKIAVRAITKGVNHGSIAAFLKYNLPEEMIWFDRRQADCHGLTKYPGSKLVDFGVYDNCFMTLLGMQSSSQPIWRLDFFGDGFRAFQRPLADHDPDGEISIFCVKTGTKGGFPPGLYLSVDLPATDEYISTVNRFDLEATGMLLTNLPIYRYRLIDGTHRVAARMPPPELMPEREEGNSLYTIRLKMDSDVTNDTVSSVPASGATLDLFLPLLLSGGCLSAVP